MLFVVKVYLIDMKKLLILFIGVLFISCNNTVPVEKIIYVPVTDTTCFDSLIYYKEQLRRTTDSLNAIRDTTAEDLFIARYKLGRIKYYNSIAAKGNNVKYLRGWINRVLNE